jgi:hypothetical protein
VNKVRVVILTALALVVAACATTPPAPKGPNVAGNWIITTDTPMGAQESQLTLLQSGEALTGKMTSQQGTTDVTGKLVGNAAAFGFAVDVQGASLKIDYEGTVEGDAMKGKTIFGSFGEGSFTAKRTL